MFIYSSQEVLLFTNSISMSYICIGEQVKTGLNIEIIMYIEEIIKRICIYNKSKLCIHINSMKQSHLPIWFSANIYDFKCQKDAVYGILYDDHVFL